jgi:protein tyrosine phosphatase (PTP) superfamily phosphohydrolase (DUF442 family)
LPSPNLDSFFGYAKAQLWAMVAEHNVINIFRTNFHAVDDKLYRSAQPTTYQLKRYIKQYGIKTVINLRRFKGRSTLGHLEKRVCDEMGVKMVSIKAYSRKIPEPHTLEAFKEVFDTIEYPALMHCKSGADRAGLGSALYLHWKRGVPLEQTGQLAFFPYGHIAQGKTGLIDYFIALYATRDKEASADVIEFVRSLDIKAAEQQFKPQPLMHFLVEKILRRE